MVATRPFLILGLALIVGLATFGAQVSHAVKRGREFDRYLSVKGLSEREVRATLAIWPVRFYVSAEDLNGLKSAMEAGRMLVVSFLKENGIDEADIALGLPIVSDRADERIQANRPALTRYRALVTLVVRSSKVELVKKAIQRADTLLERGVTLVGDPNDKAEFIFDAVNQIKPDMIKQATANARVAAEKFALDSNSKVGHIRKATQGTIEIEDRDIAS